MYGLLLTFSVLEHVWHEKTHATDTGSLICRYTHAEGLTVFRDQEFSGDMNSKPVKRIEDVRVLRGRQFNEDAGPMAHPIRPESYISMDNFYTATGKSMVCVEGNWCRCHHRC